MLSVSFSTDYLTVEAAGPAVRRLQDSIGEIEKELTRLAVLTRTDNELLELLGSNKSIGSSTSGVSVTELAKDDGLLPAKNQPNLLRTELSGLADKEKHWKEIREKLNAQIGEEEKKNARTGGALALQLMRPTAGPVIDTAILRFLTSRLPRTSGAPSYDLKVGSSKDSLHLLYKARMVQTSGIDWKKVKLSLSTATPAEGGNAPVLQAWFLRFVDPAVAGYFSTSNAQSIFMGKSAPRLVIQRQFAERRGATPGIVIRGRQSLKDLGDYVSVNEQQMDAVFDIGSTVVDVVGNGK